MKPWKWVAVGCGAVALLGVAACGGFIWVLFSLTQPVAAAGDKFVGLLGEGKTHEAYQAAAAAWKARADEEAFTAELRRLGLTDAASAAWSSRSINNNVGVLEGEVRTKQGGVIPVTLELVQEGGEWRVQDVKPGQPK
jgi:hypothetical protein